MNLISNRPHGARRSAMASVAMLPLTFLAGQNGGEESAIAPAVSAADAAPDVTPLRAPEPADSWSAPPASVSWQTVAANMQSAQTMLAAGDAGSGTQRRQREIVDSLDAMIAAASAQPPGKQGQPADPDTEDTSPTAPGDASSTEGKSANPNALESVERHGKTEVKGPEAARPKRTAAEEFWGHLPEHVRQRVLQSAENRTVPKYRTAVEEYFQKLLENESGRSESAKD